MAESSTRQSSQLDRLNREAGLRNGERFTLDRLLEDERGIVDRLRAAGVNPKLETRLGAIQKEIVAQAKKVSAFDRAYVEGLGLTCD